MLWVPQLGPDAPQAHAQKEEMLGMDLQFLPARGGQADVEDFFRPIYVKSPACAGLCYLG